MKILENIEKKIKMTPQRAAILKYLEGNASHPSAEDIFESVRKKYPMISFTTVYNTLQTLKDLDRIRELNIDDERKRYDPNVNLHHHLICNNCKKIVDIFMDFPLDISEEEAQGYMISGRHVEFYGLCPKCRKAKNKGQGDRNRN